LQKNDLNKLNTNVKNKYSAIMEKIDRILHDLDQGNANVTDTKKLVLDLFSVSYQRELLKFLGKHISEQYDIEESGLIEQLEWKAKNFNCC
tara:strand:+ start:265 stop:537 length:273 start_codon:yes stop_codon:yes gene_type:complete